MSNEKRVDYLPANLIVTEVVIRLRQPADEDELRQILKKKDLDRVGFRIDENDSRKVTFYYQEPSESVRITGHECHQAQFFLVAMQNFFSGHRS